MSFIEVLYPGNQQRRDNCVRLSQEIYSAMKGNFDSTNDLIKIMHTKLGADIAHLIFYKDKTIKENAENFHRKIAEIQSKLEDSLKINKHKIDPYLYEMLENDELELSGIYRQLRISGKVVDLVAQTIILAYSVVRTVLMALNQIVRAFCKLWIGALVLGVLVLGVDLIFSAIVGAKERKHLETTEQELQAVVDEFVPASRMYTKEITRIEMRLEDLEDHRK
ncbi:uncharacterized protein LOC134280358 [Saccostrea cucullata]|uniref:uncharacterized protein LOC134273109 n=1 Tax=Saccostrea cuccullata TaxID=36930 RepID=UPI002ED03E08